MLQKDYIHFILRSRKFWKGRSRTFYLRLRNPGQDMHFLNSAFEATNEALKVGQKVSHFYFTVFFNSFCWLWNEPLNKFQPAMEHVAWVFSGFQTHSGRCGCGNSAGLADGG